MLTVVGTERHVTTNSFSLASQRCTWWPPLCHIISSSQFPTNGHGIVCVHCERSLSYTTKVLAAANYTGMLTLTTTNQHTHTTLPSPLCARDFSTSTPHSHHILIYYLQLRYSTQIVAPFSLCQDVCFLTIACFEF